MRILQGLVLAGLVVVLAACGPGSGGAGDGRGSSDPEKVDRSQFEAVRAELEKIKDEAFPAAARAVKGEARSGKILLVPCELKGDGVGRLQLNGSLLYSDADGTTSAAAVRSAWGDADRSVEVNEDESLTSSTTVSGVRVSLVADQPVAVQQGPNAVLRRLKAGSACMDLGPELYDEMR